MKQSPINLLVIIALSACSSQSSNIYKPEAILTNCWGADSLGDGTFSLQTPIVNLGKHGWRAGTKECGGVGIDIRPDQETLGKMYEIQQLQSSNDKMGQFVFDVSLEVSVVEQTGANLLLDARNVSSFGLTSRAEVCEIFESYSGQSVCSIYSD